MTITYENVQPGFDKNEKDKLADFVQEKAKEIAKFFNQELFFDLDYNDCISRIILDGSTDAKTKTYGKMSDDDILDALAELQSRYPEEVFTPEGGLWRQINKAISGEYKSLDDIKRLADINIRLQDDPEREHRFDDESRRYLEEVNGILNRRIITKTLLGEFSRKDNSIRIFINCLPKDGGTIDESLATVLAHEMFHAFHYQISPKFRTKGYKAETVREASADFFAFVYALEHGYKNAANRMFDGWREDHLTSDPYAKAWFYIFRDIQFHEFPGRNDVMFGLKLLREIIDISVTSMQRAYEELVPEQYRHYFVNPRKETNADGPENTQGCIFINLSYSASVGWRPTDPDSIINIGVDIDRNLKVITGGYITGDGKVHKINTEVDDKFIIKIFGAANKTRRFNSVSNYAMDAASLSIICEFADGLTRKFGSFLLTDTNRPDKFYYSIYDAVEAFIEDDMKKYN